MNSLKLSDAAKEIEHWLTHFTYDYLIGEVLLKANGAYRFYVEEYGPDGSSILDAYFMTVEPDGTLKNDNGDDVIDVAQEAYDNDEDMIVWLQTFEKWYYKKGE